MNQIQIIIGPTASGKSALSINYALRISAEIISADAFQIYKDFNIGTGKLSLDEMKGIPHHLISTLSPETAYSVEQFLNDVKQTIEKIQCKNKPIIICGGSAMYLKALLYGYTPLKRLPAADRPQGTPQHLWEQLNEIDPELAQQTPYQNFRRVQRYLELYTIYKKPPSDLFISKPFDQNKYKVIGIHIEKEVLKEKINDRVDSMINNGLVDEVNDLMKKYDINSPAFRAIGYKEVIQFLCKKIKKDKMIQQIKKNTQQYAKRQTTWFKTFENVNWTN